MKETLTVQPSINTEPILTQEFLSRYKNKEPKWGFNGLGYIVYLRTYSRNIETENRKETWPETIFRCINGAQYIGANYTKDEAERLFDYIFNLKGCFSGRSLWQLGTPLVNNFKLGDSTVNCWTTKVSEIKDFTFILMESMFGGGVSASLAKEYTQELPRVKRNVHCEHLNTKDADLICSDKKEGWVNLWEAILNAYLVTGKSFTYSTICIRPQGEPLKTFGGIAPGPLPLIKGTQELCRVLECRAGKKLRTQDVADIICIGGEMIKSGGIRRTALLLGGDPDDIPFFNLKRWDLINIPNYRSNSNNSVICPSYDYLPDNYWDGFNGNGEPYGLINLPLMKKYGRLGEEKIDGFNLSEPDVILCNPCLPSWAKILTKKGISTIKKIKIGDEIWSETGWTKVINKVSQGIKKVYEYRTSACVFYGTENHKLISNGEKIEAKDCETIDVLLGEYKTDVIIDPQDVIDGLVIGDGTVHKASNNLVLLCIGQNDKDYFNSEIKDYILKHRPGINDYTYKIQTTVIYSELPKTYLRTVPSRFYYGNRNKIIGFLRGLYSANGSICGNRVTLKSSSIQLIERVQAMLSSIGIRSYYTSSKSTKIKFKNGEYVCKESYDLNISVDRFKFYQIVGFIQEYKNEKLRNLIETVEFTNHKKTSYEVLSSCLISEEEVFDITVENETHSFWNQGCNISNCGEAVLQSREPCVLSELAINNINSKEEMLDIACLLYKTSKALCALNFYHEETNKIVHQNFKVGVSITGVCQKLDVIEEWGNYVYLNLRKFDKEWSKKMGFPQSIRLTLIQPSGTKGLLFGSSPGVNPGFSKYFIRRIRFDSNDPLIPILKTNGYNIKPEERFDGTLNHGLLVIDFPCCFEEGTLVSKDCGPLKQLDIIKRLQTCWADQAVSSSVLYKKEDLENIKEYLSLYYNNSIKSVSFILEKNHGFKQAPYEEITKEQYESMVKKLKPIKTDSNIGNKEIEGLECSTGSCPVR